MYYTIPHDIILILHACSCYNIYIIIVVLLTKCGPKQFLLTKCRPYNVEARVHCVFGYYISFLFFIFFCGVDFVKKPSIRSF